MGLGLGLLLAPFTAGLSLILGSTTVCAVSSTQFVNNMNEI